MGIFKNILDLLFVPKCGACFAALPSGDEALCEGCKLKYEAEKSAKCGRCGYPIRYCRCTVGRGENAIPLVRVSGYSTRRDSVSKLMILHLKDNALRELLSLVARNMAEAFRFRASLERSEGKSVTASCTAENTYITWVGRSKRAYRRAGHDQSEELAKRISKELGFPIMRMLENVGHKAQKKLNSEERKKNAAKSHVLIADSTLFAGKNIIIIDDIVTTGASISACAEMLTNAGAGRVIALTFAQTESSREVYDDMPSVK